MINRVCDLCGTYASDSWTLVLRDEKGKVEYSGCKVCIDDLDNRFKTIKGREKMSLDKVLKELNLKR